MDIRLVSATHRELETLIQEGSFREDLFYRLNVVSLRLPPLAERREDIPLLAAHFLEKIATRYQKAVSGFAADALEYLSAASWPGNIRQLANVVEQCCVLTTGSLVTLAQVQKAVAGEASAIPTLAEAKRQFERDYLERLLQPDRRQCQRCRALGRSQPHRVLPPAAKHELTPAAFAGISTRQAPLTAGSGGAVDCRLAATKNPCKTPACLSRLQCCRHLATNQPVPASPLAAIKHKTLLKQRQKNWHAFCAKGNAKLAAPRSSGANAVPHFIERLIP